MIEDKDVRRSKKLAFELIRAEIRQTKPVLHLDGPNYGREQPPTQTPESALWNIWEIVEGRRP